jgi:FkbM family methyltransferase
MVDMREPLRLNRLERKQAARDARKTVARAGRQPPYPVEFRSQFGEDVLLWTLFDRRLDGFFIEVGAFDGYTYSGSYALECVGWHGLLVEAIPERAAECAARRLHSRVVHAALGSAPGEAAFTITDDGYGGLFSALDGVPQRKTFKNPPRRVTVPVTTLDVLLADVEHVDAAIIDVEGCELEVLAGFDLARYRPEVLIIEDNGGGNDPAIANYFSTLPYVQVAWLRVNRVYVHRDVADSWSGRLLPLAPPGDEPSAAPDGMQK